MTGTIPLTVELTGGLEMLFSGKKKHTIALPLQETPSQPPTVAFLIKYLCDQVMKDPRKEMFILDDSVRPGILVLINDVDWELEGQDEYELQPNDNIIFVSTLHGG